MIWHDTTSARAGLVEDMENVTQLGSGAISGNATLYGQFTNWANQWQKRVIRLILNSEDGFDFDDANYTTYPSGTFVGTTNRDYEFDATQKMLKLKKVAISYDGTNETVAKPIDSNDPDYWKSRHDTNLDQLFSQSAPRYDPRAAGFDILPKFTAAQVAAGAYVFVEFFRDAKTDFATSGTDTLEPGFDSAFHQVVSKGASYEYCKINKPDLAAQLKQDIFGIKTRYANQPGMLDEVVDFYSFRVPQAKRLRPMYRNPR